jgi:hypothetical protein
MSFHSRQTEMCRFSNGRLEYGVLDFLSVKMSFHSGHTEISPSSGQLEHVAEGTGENDISCHTEIMLTAKTWY